MNIFFKIIFSVFIFAGAAQTAETQTPAAVDPDAPAPASPVQVRLPHSERTKDNILDSVLDFMFTGFFKLYKDVEISYAFFEAGANGDLDFTDFKVKSLKPSAQGVVTVSKMKVNLKEFLSFIKGKQLVVSKIDLTDVSADMTLTGKKEEKENKRSLTYRAKQMTLNNVLLGEFGSKRKKEKNKTSALSVKTVTVDQASLSLSNPDEKYAVSKAAANDVVLSSGVVENVSFSSAEADGKTYAGRAAFLRAVKR